jgi:FixJ family two-component response regulator
VSTETSARPILLATDDSNDVFAFWGYHRQCGIHNRVEVVSDGEDALRYLASTKALPAVLVLSLKMPQIGGLKVLELLAGIHTKIPKVLLIDEKDQDVRLVAAAIKLGVEAFLMRPVVKAEFCSLMSRFRDTLTMDGCRQPDTPSVSTRHQYHNSEIPNQPGVTSESDG